MKRSKAPRASAESKKTSKEFEEKLSIWFTIAVLLLVFVALVIFFINKIEKNSGEVVAVVNGEKITEPELERWYKISVVPEFRDNVEKEEFLVESLIPQKILVQEAEKEKITVENDELETEFGNFLIDIGLSLREFEKEMEKDDIEIEFVKESFRQRIMINKLLNKTVLSEVELSASEVNDILESTTSLDPTLTAADIKKVIEEQLLKRKRIEALESFTNQLIENADVKLHIGDENIKSFTGSNDEICREEGKPIVRLFTTSTCMPCEWIKDTFDEVMKDFIEEDKITAFHWQLDTGDNTLTKKKEEGIPKKEIEIFKKYNKRSTVPTYVFGCKYVRIGNFYQENRDLDAEEKEFRAVVEKLI